MLRKHGKLYPLSEGGILDPGKYNVKNNIQLDRSIGHSRLICLDSGVFGCQICGSRGRWKLCVE